MDHSEVHDPSEYQRLIEERIGDAVESTMWLQLWDRLEGRGDWHLDLPGRDEGLFWGFGILGEHRLSVSVVQRRIRLVIREADPLHDLFEWDEPDDLVSWLDRHELDYAELSAVEKSLADRELGRMLDQEGSDDDGSEDDDGVSDHDCSTNSEDGTNE